MSVCDAPETDPFISSPIVEPLASAPVPRLAPAPPLPGEENERLLSLADASDRSRFIEVAAAAGAGNPTASDDEFCEP